tara:strand:+ start:1250 stop:1483 length:234 start_codon:yes stop_codon:yes gene_type:complete
MQDRKEKGRDTIPLPDDSKRGFLVQQLGGEEHLRKSFLSIGMCLLFENEGGVVKQDSKQELEISRQEGEFLTRLRVL